MQNPTITCDGCGNDITYATNSEDYRLVLSSEDKDHNGGFVTDMHIPPDIGRNHHFCDMRCIWKWLKKFRFAYDDIRDMVLADSANENRPPK